MATKKFVPRGNNEGGIGDSSRRWKEVHAATGSFYNGLSGSLQTLTNGLSYLVEGSNITIVTESNGQITISTSGGSFDLEGDSGASETIVGGDTLRIEGGSNISTVVGATDTLTVNLDSQITVDSLTASNGVQIGNDDEHVLTNDAGTLKWKGASITTGGMTSFKVTGSHDSSTEISISNSDVLIISGSDAINIVTDGPNNTVTASLLLDGSTLQQSNAGLKVNPNLEVDTLTTTGDLTVGGNIGLNGNLILDGDLRVNGSTTTIETENLLVKDRFILLASGANQVAGEPPVQGGIIVASGALGDNQSLIFGASGSMWHATQGDAENGVIIAIPDTGDPSPYVPLAASEFRLSGSDVRRLTTDGSNVILTSDNMLQFTGSADFKDPSIFNQGLTGSLTRIKKSDGSLVKYIEGNSEIKVTTGSFGEIQLKLHPGAGGVNFTAGDGLHLNDSNILSASLVEESEGGNLRFVNSKLDLSESISLTDISASNAVSSSYFVLGDGITGDPESGKNTLWINSSDGNKLYLRGSQLAAGSVAADDVTLGNAPANFKTDTGDIGVSGSNIGLTGSLIEIHGENHSFPIPLIIDGREDNEYKIRYQNAWRYLKFDQNGVRTILSSDAALSLQIGNQSADQIFLSVFNQTAGRISLSTSPSPAVDFRDSSNNSAIKYSSDNVEISKILTASLGVSSSLYTFENQATSQNFEDGQLINITGSLFWKNPNDDDALRILSGSVESGGVNFTAGDGLHLDGSDVLSASLVEESEGGNLRFVNSKLDLSESISLTDISASNAVSSSYFVLGDGFTSDPESGKNTLWVNTGDSNKLYLRDALLAAGSVAADDVTPGNDPARFETTKGDIGISGSNIGLTGSIISLHEHNTKRGEIDLSSNTLEIKSSNDMDFKYNNTHSFLKAADGFDTLILSASSNVLGQGGALVLGTSHTTTFPSTKPSIKLEVNDSTKSRIVFDVDVTEDVIFNYGSSDEVYRYNSDDITFSKIVTASNGISSSLYTFKNQATSPTFYDSQLINVTGSLYWKNPNDSTELKILSGSEAAGVNFTAGPGIYLNESDVLSASLVDGGNLELVGNGNNAQLDLKDEVSITHLTASSQVSSSLYVFKNYESGELPPTSENSSLFNATGSLFWRNPTDGSEARILSGSAGVSFTTDNGIHLDESTGILSASLVENGNLEIVNSKIDLKDDVSITNLTASNAVSSSLYTFKDVGEGTTSNYSNQLYNVTGTLYWNTNDALLSGSSGYGLVRSIKTQSIFNQSVPTPILVDKSNTTVLLDITNTSQTGTLPSYTSFPSGFYFTIKNKSNTLETELKPWGSQYLDGIQNDTVKLQPKSSLTFVYAGTNVTNYGWIIE